MAVIHLNSADDVRLKAYVSLTERQLRDNLEADQGVLVAESEKVVRVALAQGLKPLSLLIEQRQLDTRADLVEQFCSLDSGAEILESSGHLQYVPCDEPPVYVLPATELSRLVGYKVTRGVHALFKRPQTLVAQDLFALLPSARRIAVLEGITDATNVGAAFRSAAALNVDAVLLTPTCCDPLVRRSVRVSMGTVFQVPWARLGSWPQDINLLRSLGFRVAALALRDDSHALGERQLRTIDKLAMVFGTEGDGLALETIEACDLTIKIPMSHEVDSLNVAAASAVAFWELCRYETED